MNDKQSLSHRRWESTYHMTWIPKNRKKEIYRRVAEISWVIFEGSRIPMGRPDFAGPHQA